MPRTPGAANQKGDDANLADVVDAINANTDATIFAIREELRAEMRAEMQTEMQEMRTLIAAILGLDAMTQVLENGFGTLTDQIRRIVPTSNAVSVDESVAQRIGELRDSLRSPDLSDIGRLEVGFKSVSFVGGPVDHSDSMKGQ